jgi:hypothetical protein
MRSLKPSAATHARSSSAWRPWRLADILRVGLAVEEPRNPLAHDLAIVDHRMRMVRSD